MAFVVLPKGFDGEHRLNFDSLGKLYISIAIIWTTLVVCGSWFLLYNRHLPALRVRNTHLWTATVAFLHAYWVLCLLAYMINGTYPCTAEFWIMSLWLPFGIALYQVNGMHLLRIASLQTRFIYPQALFAYRGSRYGKNGWRRFWNLGLPDSLSQLQKNCILTGVILQILVSLVIFLISRKFHTPWGAVGHAVSPGQCRRGWEWVPSIAWQFFWAWIYAPYLLWKVRKIDDLHGWRLQTTICCLAGLPGSPMWLLALYSPRFSPGLATASRYFVPPLWFTPGIVAMEISVILIPCLMVVKSQKLQKETLQQLVDWERKQDSGTSLDTGTTYVPTLDDLRAPSPAPSTGPIRSELYSMKALEKALTTNITPLLRFSALKDFSGENISFLKHVQDWKASWTIHTQPPAGRHLLTKRSSNLTPLLEPDSLRRHQFALGVEIYVCFISSRYSDFPINISCPQSKDLESIFSHAASTLNAPTQENTATPFDSSPSLPHPTPPLDDIEHHASNAALARQPSSGGGRDKDTISIASTTITTPKITNTNTTSNTKNQPPNSSSSKSNGYDSTTTTPPPTVPFLTSSLLEVQPHLATDIAIPPTFGPHVFDEAERAVKYGVLTNTWPKFVAAGLVGREKEGRDKVKEKEGREKGEGNIEGKGMERGRGGGWTWTWLLKW